MKIASFINLNPLEKQHWFKIFAITLIATSIFYALLELFSAKEISAPIVVPATWQKIELSLHGNYFAQEGEYISVVENNGDIMIKKGLLVEIKHNDQSGQENPFGNTWRALIATEVLNNQKLKELNLKRPDQIFLSPYNKNLSAVKRFLKKEVAYEITY